MTSTDAADSAAPGPAALALTADDLTPAWLSGALGRPVRAARAVAIGTGQIGTVYRVFLEGDGVPGSILAKLPASDPVARAMLAGAYRRELLFYTRLTGTVAVRAPHCYYARGRGDCAEFTLLLEDMAPARQGDQLAGCDVTEAEAAVRNLAALHAPRWCDPALLDEDGLSPATTEEADMLAEYYGPALDTFLDRIGDRLDPADAATLRGCVDTSAAWLLARPERFALVHGDYRLDNLLFSTGCRPTGVGGSSPLGSADGRGDQQPPSLPGAELEEGRGSIPLIPAMRSEEPEAGPVIVTAVDWQTLGLALPARDLAFFIGTSMEPEQRGRHERHLVEQYHRALCSRGVTGYTLEHSWQDYVFALPQGPLIAVFGAAFGTSTPRGDEMFAAMTRRSCAAIRELSALGAEPA
ncbi:phosphotransferase [Nocardia higoensis]|uniref:phosphotransferase n=1 Tax=Nocardia higoensis TaxID=228599 RepID=UPI000306C6A3|nr:phosphotransferase [Nocardia higoensis]